MPEPTPYWLLIAVLQSTIPLAEALAMRLYRAAVDLHRDAGSVSQLTGDLAMGQVRRLGQDMIIGTFGGPGFEADLDTPHGSGRVRFIVTRQGLEQDGQDDSEGARALPPVPTKKKRRAPSEMN